MKKIFFVFFAIMALAFTGCVKEDREVVPTPPLTENQHADIDANTLACKDIEQQIKDDLELIKACTQDTDCIVDDQPLSCPFGCYLIMNKNTEISKIKAMRDEIADYSVQCNSCTYKCSTPPTQGELGCRNNVCVDLRYFAE